jgi:hypothetical protein
VRSAGVSSLRSMNANTKAKPDKLAAGAKKVGRRLGCGCMGCLADMVSSLHAGGISP